MIPPFAGKGRGAVAVPGQARHGELEYNHNAMIILAPAGSLNPWGVLRLARRCVLGGTHVDDEAADLGREPFGLPRKVSRGA
jgi:hypothetical protein